MTSPTHSDVAAYYDANTNSFKKTGQGGASIRRAIWADGVTSRDDAFRVLDNRILTTLRTLPTPRRVVDLGCGLGSSLKWLRDREVFEGIGVTLSKVQADSANNLFRASPDLRCLHASYTELPTEIVSVDLAFAIESFAHSPSVREFITPIASRLRVGGQLMVCDDFLGPTHRQASKLIDDFRFGWVAASLVAPEALVAEAAAVGLELSANEDFTDCLELGRPRDRVLSVVAGVLRPFATKSWLVRSWVGGTALQAALRRRAIEHRLLTFTKR